MPKGHKSQHMIYKHIHKEEKVEQLTQEANTNNQVKQPAVNRQTRP